MKTILSYCLIFLWFCNYAQEPCAYHLTPTSTALEDPNTTVSSEMMEVKIKNDYQIQFIKVDKKNYLKIIVRDNLGFGKTGSLLLQPIKKQIYIKSTKLHIIDKSSGYFIIDLNNSYYLNSIKDYGLTKIIFNENVEFSIPKNDSEKIKKLAECYFDIVKDNIWPTVRKL